MVKPRKAKSLASRSLKNQRRTRLSFAEALSSANQRAHEKANRRVASWEQKQIWAAVADHDFEDYDDSTQWMKRLTRWCIALMLLPLCWVTAWTFLARFSQAAVHQDFWKTPEFWYFATGALVMIGWFWSGLFKSFFLYLYVLGHELTHAVFVLLFRGKVTGMHVSTDGGYITTNKTNLLIALSPYFVPFWSVVAAVVYIGLSFGFEFSQKWDRILYLLMGLTWTFHIAWTLWMIPRDQPDLKENGTFLSLAVILLANLSIMAGLLCLASESPLQSARDFGIEWLRYSSIAGDLLLYWLHEMMRHFRTA